MAKTIGESVRTLGDIVADRIALADLPSQLVASLAFDPNMGNTRTGYRFDIDGYGSVLILAYLPEDDKLEGVTFKRDDAAAARVAGGRRVKFTWQDGDRLVVMTVPTAMPVDKVTSIKLATVG